MRCKGMKKGPVRKADGTLVASDRIKNCGKQATVFFRIRYSELRTYHDNGVYEDTLGFCEECAKGKDKPSGYTGHWNDRKVLHLRGDVACVEPGDASTVEDEIRNKRLHDGKREFLKIMSTKGNRDLMDDWETVFDLALKGFQVKAVMGQ